MRVDGPFLSLLKGRDRLGKNMLDHLNNPITFLLAMTLGVTALQAVFRVLFQKIGWTGAAGVFGAK